MLLSRSFFPAVALLAAAAAFPVAAQPSHMPEDWSNRHVVYSNPDTAEQAAAKGSAAYQRYLRHSQDIRYLQQVVRKKIRLTTPDGTDVSKYFTPEQLRWFRRFDLLPESKGAAEQRDWSHVLGGVGGVGRAGVFPAKYSFDVNAAPSCANDFIVYGTATAGANSTGAFAARNGTFSNRPTAGQTVTIARAGAPNLVLTAHASSNADLFFSRGANATESATNLAAAIARNGGQVGVTATSSGTTVTVTSLTAGTASNSVTLNDGLSNFSWAGGTLAGGTNAAGQPTIVAFNQIYRSCVATPAQRLPSTFWSYNTGVGAVADLSPVISLNGSQVAFVQRTSNQASLVLLKWSSSSPGTVGNPTVPTSVTAANYRTCTAPCMTVLPFNGNPNNTYSSPFYDYAGDVVYVGDDSGRLHKFTGVFNATPAEQTTGGFPATVSTGNRLSSPVYDSESGRVFVGSDFNSGSATNGGRLHAVAADGTVASSAQLARQLTSVDFDPTTGVRDAPIVDPIAGRVYAFVESGISDTGCAGFECKAVYQLATNFIDGSTWTGRAQIGRGQKWYRTLYGGMFDDAYFNSADPANPTGNMYVCGSQSDGTTSQRPTLWKIPINSNAIGTPAAGPTLVTADTFDCSPVTLIKNGTAEYLFVSTPQGVTDPGNFNPPTMTGCGGGGTCTVFMFNLTGATWNGSLAAGATLAATGGTGGIVVDNISSVSGASQVYYATQGTTGVGNAVQASQAGLQ